MGDLDLFLRIVPKPSHVQFATNPCFELWIIPLTNEILNILPVRLPPLVRSGLQEIWNYIVDWYKCCWTKPEAIAWGITIIGCSTPCIRKRTWLAGQLPLLIGDASSDG